MVITYHVPLFNENKNNKIEKAHNTDAGFDLRANEDYVLQPERYKFFHTGLRIIIPKGLVGIVKPRSGLAFKHGIDVLAGVIDAGYSGEILVGLVNHGTKGLKIKKGDKIAQLIFLYLPSICLQPVNLKTFTALAEQYERAENGFGSSG